MVRCKFKLVEVRRTAYNPAGGELRFRAEYDPSLKEDVSFSKATPTGEIVMQCDNAFAFAQFEVGKSYYFDASEVDTPAA